MQATESEQNVNIGSIKRLEDRQDELIRRTHGVESGSDSEEPSRRTQGVDNGSDSAELTGGDRIDDMVKSY